MIDVGLFRRSRLDRVIEVPWLRPPFACRYRFMGGQIFLRGSHVRRTWALPMWARRLPDPLIAAGVALRAAANCADSPCAIPRAGRTSIASDIAMLTGPAHEGTPMRAPSWCWATDRPTARPAGRAPARALAVLHAGGALAVGQAWRHQSSIGTGLRCADPEHNDRGRVFGRRALDFLRALSHWFLGSGRRRAAIPVGFGFFPAISTRMITASLRPRSRRGFC